MKKFAVIYDESVDRRSQSLAEQLDLPLLPMLETVLKGHEFFLCYRDGCLRLLDTQSLNKGGLAVEIDPRPGEQHSYPAPKKDLLAQAIGKKTESIIDATAGWAQDSLALFRMGYQVTCIERAPIMAELIRDGFERLAHKEWVQRRQLLPPELWVGDAIQILSDLKVKPDCIYLDPMFPPKPKQTAATRKSMAILRDILGHDLDRQALFAAAIAASGRRVVVKSPDYAEPLGGKPNQRFQGKLLRYDVYLK